MSIKDMQDELANIVGLEAQVDVLAAKITLARTALGAEMEKRKCEEVSCGDFEALRYQETSYEADSDGLLAAIKKERRGAGPADAAQARDGERSQGDRRQAAGETPDCRAQGVHEKAGVEVKDPEGQAQG